MVRNLFKAFLVSAACALLASIYALASGKEVFAEGTQTPTPFLVMATFTPVAESRDSVGETILLKVSHYWPPLGGINCANYVNGRCLSNMASGERWKDWIEQAIACPPEFPFGTQIQIGEKVWICLDRGGAIQIQDGYVWVDMLIKDPPYNYGEVVKGEILPEMFVFNGTE